MGDMFPALLSRASRPLDRGSDAARRVLWRAFQRGTLNEDELASSLDRLGRASRVPNSLPDQHQSAEGSEQDTCDFHAPQ